MVRWNKDNESGGLSLPGTGFIWDNNVDTVHGTFTTVISDKVAERGARPVLALHRSPRREVRLRVDRAPGLLDLRRQRPGHVGRAAGGDLRPVDTLSLWMGNHTMKTGASFTYDVTEQLFQPLQNGRYTSPARRPWRRTPFQFRSRSRSCPRRG